MRIPKSRVIAIVSVDDEGDQPTSQGLRQFAGKPLYHHVVESVATCSQIDQVMVATGSADIAGDAMRNLRDVRIFRFRKDLCTTSATLVDRLMAATEDFLADTYLHVAYNHPLLTSQTIAQALATYLHEYPKHDSLFSVTRARSRLWDAQARAINHNAALATPVQDLQPIYVENSVFYIFTRTILEERFDRIGYRPRLFELYAHEAWRITQDEDFPIGELLREQHRAPGVKAALA